MLMDRSVIDEVFQYHPPDAEQVEAMIRIRHAAKELAYIILEVCPASADKSDAFRKLREVVMVANASIVLNGII